MMNHDRAPRLSRFAIPKACCVIVTSDKDRISIRTKNGREGDIRQDDRLNQASSRLRVPQADRVVRRNGDESCSIRAEACAENRDWQSDRMTGRQSPWAVQENAAE